MEQLHDNVDLNVPITRAEFEGLAQDLFARVPGPLLRVAELAGVPLVRHIRARARVRIALEDSHAHLRSAVAA